jgi:hypothetical protein
MDGFVYNEKTEESMKTILLLIGLLCSLCASAVQFEVKPRTCYEVAYRARVVNGPCREMSPQLSEIIPLSVSRFNATAVSFCAVQWRFKNSSGKKISRPHEGASPQTLFSREWTEYRYRFWTPENAAFFELYIQAGSKKNRAEIADARLEEVKSPAILNFNGDFSAADDAAPGWQLVGSAVFQNISPGKSEVNTLIGHVNGDLFPVTPGSSIKVEAVCSNPVVIGSRHDYTNVRLEFYPSYVSAAGKNARSKALVEPPLSPSGNPGVKSRIYRVPAGKRWARVSAWHGIVKKISVVEEGGVK